MSVVFEGNDMVEEMDVIRSAKLIHDQYGGEAVLEAKRRAFACFQGNDFVGQRVWNEIAIKCEWLSATDSANLGTKN